ncbi:nose resistant to fluoxetine protein 6-like [Macrosteles quadrilineatus]|uniref:nose resistant to fluoxetine protein 6-like n=1 Tax=Macrosteles quadrilineatus TaxID=74068 RepID=UPI0023E2B11A|nr:nose resistant to fluoxetine protein 6-like [Macrosteles quadrilineatus]
MMKLPAYLLLVVVSCASASFGPLPPSLDIARLESLEPGCQEDLEKLRRGLDTGQRWAQTMWDASVKSPVGILSQTAVQFGDFDECLTVESPVAAQFCMADVAPGRTNITLWAPFKMGVCVPASCSARGLQDSLQILLANGSSDVTVHVIPEACTTKETVSRPTTTNDLIFILIVTGAILIVSAATVHDIILNPDYDKVSPPRRLVECLSARRGWYSLFRADPDMVPGVNLGSLYGLHACAFFFVVLGHRFGVHFFFMSLTNYRGVEHMFVGSWFSMWVGHMDLFVDIFFFMSAFLLSLVYYSELHKRFISPVMVYFHRLCRLVPAYALVVFFYATLLRQLGDGPMWNMFMDVEQSKCRDYWWTNLLFINTYVESENMCLLQSWYISCDFQLFVVGTILVFMLHQSPKAGAVTTGLVFLASTITPFLGTYLYDRPALLLFYKDFWADPRHHDLFTSIYSQGHYRGTSYLMGLFAGLYIYKHRKEPLSQARNRALQIAGFACCLSVFWSGSLFYNTSAPISPLIAATYAALHHSVFGLGLALLLVSYTLGTSTYMSQFFSWRGFVPFSKLSYCVYLIHNIPQFVWIASSRTAVTLNTLELVSWSIADVVISLLFSLVLFLTIETPVRYFIKFMVTAPAPPKSQVLPQTAEPQERYINQDPFGFQKR